MKIIATLFLILSLALPVNAETTLTFGYINAPLSYSSLSVLKAAYAKIGIQAKGLTLPAARALAQSDAGLTDGEVHRIEEIELEHPNLIRIPVAINTVEGLAVSCNKSVDTTDLAVFSTNRIGIKIGTRYAEKLTQSMPYVTKSFDENKLMELLAAQRLDVVIGDRPWAEKQGGLCDARINEPPLVVIPLYHYLHKRHAGLVPKITQVLMEMQKSGEIEAIVRKALTYVQTNPVPAE
ncbi:transporter substrate-binding domain-containing protein [Pseudodesulfovibrio sp.]|nr:transporter substrate-binding domain-containing protein [Pseudodesulfovibrio sp.]